MGYSLRKIEKIASHYFINGIENTSRYFKIKENTVRRIVRLFNERNRTDSIPNILLFDIETLPMQVRVWGLYKQRIPIDNIVKDWIVLSWAAKWLCDSKIETDILTPEECLDRDDERIIKGIWKLIDKADIVIAHNGKRFDIRKLNSRFIMHGLPKPSPYQVIDTLEHSRKNFAFSSHKLDWLGQLVRNEGKIDTDYELWKRCEAGEPEALVEMLKYNIEDVYLLEEVYLWMRGWMNSHPNMNMYVETNDAVCPNCGHGNLDYNGYYYTPAGKYQAFRCRYCGAIGRQRSTVYGKIKNAESLRSIAR